MRHDALLATTALLACGLTATADAAPRKSCNLVKDAANDVSNDVVGGDGAFPADAGLDLVGADVASNAEDIAAVVRLGAAPGTATAYAKRYIAQFKVKGQKYPMLLAAIVTPTGWTYNYGYYGPSTAGATGDSFVYSGTATGKTEGKVITISAPLSAAEGVENLGEIKKNAKISAFSITANRRVPPAAQVTGQVFVADEATGKGPYYAGRPSCIKASL